MRALRQAVSGQVLVPGDPGYQVSTLQWSKTFARRPCVVLRCNTTADVQAGMAYARTNHLPLSARSGGHSYMGWSVLNGSLLLDLRRINHVRVAANKKTAEIGPGALSDDVVRTLALEHKVQTSTGGCPTVALGGFLLGGGHPIIARSTGAGVDNVRGHTVVLANGTVVQTSATQHQELYWGLRGSCGFSFGIVTSFHMKLYPDPCAGPGGCYAGHLIYAPEDVTAVAHVFAEYVPKADPKLGMEAFTFTAAANEQSAPRGGFLVPGVWNGYPSADGLAALQPLLNIPNVTILENTFAKRDSYWEAWLAGIGGPRDPMAPVRREYIQSAFMKKPLPKPAWEALFAGAVGLGVNGSVGMNAMGGVWGQGATNKTAYPHRDFLFNLEMNAVWYVLYTKNLLYTVLDSRRVFGFDPQHQRRWGQNTSQIQILRHFEKGVRC